MPKARTHARVHETGDDGEVIPVIGEHLKVRRGRVIRSALAGNEALRQKAERSANANHAPGLFEGTSGARFRGSGEAFQPGQGKGDARGSEEGAAVDGHSLRSYLV